MFKLFILILNIFLIFIISLKVPESNVGLTSSTQRNFDLITIFGIFIYLAIAIKLNLMAI